jgi:hypothetical protein
MSVHFSSKSEEHYTPREIIRKVIAFYQGTIDLDPCSNSHEDPWVPAATHYTKEDNGQMQLPWKGKVWVNPPYGRSLGEWSRKARWEYEEGEASQILLLVPSRTDTAWYHHLSSYPRCNIRGRLKFINPDNKGSSAPFPSVIFYLGEQKYRFREAFLDLGEIVAPLEPAF